MHHVIASFDYRIISHIFHAISKGFTMTTVYCNDTDIVVIILAFLPMLLQASPQIQVFIHHDSEVLNLNNMCANLGIENCRMLLFLHAFSGCDYTPSFFGVGKTKFFDEMVKNIDRYRHTFTELSLNPSNVRAEQLKVIQKFVFASYGEEDFETVEDVRFDSLLYTVENSFRKWVPTSGAIMEQAKRAAYIAGHLWGRADDPRPELPPITEWGYLLTQSNICIPRWTLDEHTGICKRLCETKCGCRGKTPCSNKKCSCSNTRCLPVLCKCKGKCEKDNPTDDEEGDKDNDDE